MQPSSSPDNLTKQVNIVTTENGFTIQEQFSVNKFILPPDDPKNPFIPQVLKDSATEFGEITSDKGKDYVIKAEATLAFNFSASGSKPAINVESNNISYGNTAVEKVMDKRNWKQVVVDFIKNLVGASEVKDLSQVQREEKENLEGDAPTSSIHMQ